MTEMTSDTFECVLRSDEPLAKVLEKWPEKCRKASDAAVARLMANHPEAKIIKDTSIVMMKDHPRFTNDGRYEYALVRTIKLDRSVPV